MISSSGFRMLTSDQHSRSVLSRLNFSCLTWILLSSICWLATSQSLSVSNQIDTRQSTFCCLGWSRLTQLLKLEEWKDCAGLLEVDDPSSAVAPILSIRGSGSEERIRTLIRDDDTGLWDDDTRLWDDDTGSHLEDIPLVRWYTYICLMYWSY